MSDYAAREEAALEEETRRRAEDIRATDEAAFAAAADEAANEAADPSPDAELARVHRSGRQHDYTDTAAYQSPRPGRRRGGPRR